jgi:hypothetical protein
MTQKPYPEVQKHRIDSYREVGWLTTGKDSPDDNRFDLRPFLYPPFTAAYKKIEAAVSAIEVAGLRRPVQEEKKDA